MHVFATYIAFGRGASEPETLYKRKTCRIGFSERLYKSKNVRRGGWFLSPAGYGKEVGAPLSSQVINPLKIINDQFDGLVDTNLLQLLRRDIRCIEELLDVASMGKETATQRFWVNVLPKSEYVAQVLFEIPRVHIPRFTASSNEINSRLHLEQNEPFGGKYRDSIDALPTFFQEVVIVVVEKYGRQAAKSSRKRNGYDSLPHIKRLLQRDSGEELYLFGKAVLLRMPNR